MPLYEYIPVSPNTGCPTCSTGLEVFQKISDPPLTHCPECNGSIKKTVSLCRAAVMETSEESSRVEQQIKNYEKEGMYSHAAELADKHSEKTDDNQLKSRAKDNYRKAGYDISD